LFRVSRFDAFVGHVSRGESAEKDGDAVLLRLTFCEERERKEALVIVFVLIQHPNILPLLLLLLLP